VAVQWLAAGCPVKPQRLVSSISRKYQKNNGTSLIFFLTLESGNHCCSWRNRLSSFQKESSSVWRKNYSTRKTSISWKVLKIFTSLSFYTIQDRFMCSQTEWHYFSLLLLYLSVSWWFALSYYWLIAIIRKNNNSTSNSKSSSLKLVYLRIFCPSLFASEYSIDHTALHFVRVVLLFRDTSTSCRVGPMGTS